MKIERIAIYFKICNNKFFYCRFRDFPVQDLAKFKIKQIKKKEVAKGRSTMSAYIRYTNESEYKLALKANNTVSSFFINTNY